MATNKPSLKQQLAQLTGHRLGPYMSHNPVSRTQVWQWCSAMGDNNPLYLGGEKVIAPPAMMQMWTMRDFNDRYAPGSTDAAPYKVFDDMTAMGYPANVAVSYDISFHRYLEEGEQVQHYTTVVNISDQKTTGLGVGFFVTERVEYLTLKNDLFAEALITYFQYQIVEHEGDGKAAAKADGRPDYREPQPGAAHSGWQPDFLERPINALKVGDKLPELMIPITHKLIVGGAIATQDFIPVHHSAEAARAAAMPNIFMNILTTSGLSARYFSDWAGKAGRLKKLKFSLLAPNLPGDIMILEGEVFSINDSDVTINFGGKNSLGYHVKGVAILAL